MPRTISYIALAAVMAVGLAGPVVASAAKSRGTVRVTVTGVGGPAREHATPLAGVAVRVTRLMDTAPLAEARTGRRGTATLTLTSGRYVVSGYLTAPAVVPERTCEAKPKTITVRPGKMTTVNISCSIK
jgi:hypothetical protein